MTITVVGLGNTGLSCIRHLLKYNKKIHVVDSRTKPPCLEYIPKHPNISVSCGNFCKQDFQNAQQIVVSPGVDHNKLIAQGLFPKDIPVVGDIELFSQINTLPVIAITGSNGKSTVTTLLGEMAKNAGLKVGLGGNLGTPALSLLDNNYELIILELSSFQLETTYSLKTIAATILNISPDHLDRYNSFYDYVLAKQRILKNTDNIIFNREDTCGLNKSYKSNYLSFGWSKAKYPNFGYLNIDGEIWLSKGEDPILPYSKLGLIGNHNALNALAVLALAENLQLPYEIMKKTLIEFKGLPHRCELLGKFKGLLWVNDSKSTNVGSTLAALHSLTTVIFKKWLLILGGRTKKSDFKSLIKSITATCRIVIVFGEATPVIIEALHKHILIVKVSNIQEAIQVAQRLAEPGDGVLFSPACSSLDMFKNFAQRGDIFKHLVESL